MKSENNQREELAVVIVNYKTSHLIKPLLASLIEDDLSLKIVIVDNASTADSLNVLHSIDDPRLIILDSNENRGFTGGVNYAISHIVTHLKNIKYMFLLNPDAQSTPQLINQLLKVIRTDKRIACVSPKIGDLKGGTWYAGAQIRFEKGIVLNNHEELDCANDKLIEIDVFSGCAVLFDLEKVVEVGLFNPHLFMYYDEADLSIRLRNNGYKVIYDPTHTIFHDVSYTTRRIPHLKTYYMTRNKFIVFNKKMSLYNKVYFIIHETAYHLKNGQIRNAYYHLKGYYHFLLGKTGAYM